VAESEFAIQIFVFGVSLYYGFDSIYGHLIKIPYTT
jgi:hypothetical protein